MHSKTHILLIYTGGTIGMTRHAKTKTLRPFDFGSLLENIPELNLLDCSIETFSFDPPIDSSNMDPDHWYKMALLIASNYEKFDGFVILHGSDTMSYTASALSFVLENLTKPVILTGSQLPIGDLRTDAKENMITAIQLAALRKEGAALIQEVGLYFEYKLYRGNRTTKINAEHFQAFASLNYPPMAESGVHLKVFEENLWKRNANFPFIAHKDLSDKVGLLKIFPGMRPDYVQHFLNNPALEGLVIETFGAGNAPTADWLLEALAGKIKDGMKIVNATQCSGGAVSMGQYETSQRLKDVGLLSAKDMTTESAVTKMMYLLTKNLGDKEFKITYETSLCGEIS
jgi:L-asparaginase